VPSSAARSALRAALGVTAAPVIRWVAGMSGRGPVLTDSQDGDGDDSEDGDERARYVRR
jgi:hypothetical protein